MKIIVIIQARMGSTRLPGKVLLPLGSSSILNYVVQRCHKINHVEQVIVATSTDERDDRIAEWCESHQVSYYRGSEDDVLARYYECAVQYDPDYVIRVTSDCPFLDFDLANYTIEQMRQQPVDVIVNKQQEQLTRGLAVELISFAALQRIYKHSTAPRHREHVTYYAYEYISEFKHLTIELPDQILKPDIRLTVDTPEDYEVCRILADQLEDSINRPAADFIAHIINHPDIGHINAHIKQKPVLDE
ncbi:glycosyltransferase family protein [Paenibacillus hunanensis]|uniref:cytidylyltransferase domain-containing protein n=1 Tax=Paenibacillus hunanensis TaxID=539262 RepID=UPI00202609B9|nr:glycosyltransferase family protein [Paenibacillus hunanensis]MCL9662766.1 glycosyltransferase family protein [Paenibacillus hunanensis]